MLKEKDFRLISELRKDSRATLTNISRKTSIPVSTIFDKLKIYKRNIVNKFTCVLNFGNLGYKSHSFTVFTINKNKRLELQDYLSNSKNVNAIYRINHKYDFLVDLIFQDIQELEEFIDSVDEEFSIRLKHIFYVVNVVGKELFLSTDCSVLEQKP